MNLKIEESWSPYLKAVGQSFSKIGDDGMITLDNQKNKDSPN